MPIREKKFEVFFIIPKHEIVFASFFPPNTLKHEIEFIKTRTVDAISPVHWDWRLKMKDFDVMVDFFQVIGFLH